MMKQRLSAYRAWPRHFNRPIKDSFLTVLPGTSRVLGWRSRAQQHSNCRGRQSRETSGIMPTDHNPPVIKTAITIADIEPPNLGGELLLSALRGGRI
jgi:hypothetical protein